MSEAFRCFMCGGHGDFVVDEFGDEGPETTECPRCKGSGGLNLRPAGAGFPKSDDPYIAVPKGVNW